MTSLLILSLLLFILLLFLFYLSNLLLHCFQTHSNLIINEYYSQENLGPYKIYNIGDFELEEGGKIPECKLAYVTYGELNESKDNAILVLIWYSGSNKSMEPYRVEAEIRVKTGNLMEYIYIVAGFVFTNLIHIL